MLENPPTSPLVIRLATPEDIATIDLLDSFSTSPTRDIHRAMEQYFGSVDPSIHERTLIFLAEMNGVAAAKAELMLPPVDSEQPASTNTISTNSIGYIKRVVVHPQYRKHGLARHLMLYIIAFARTEPHIAAIDLHVWEGNIPAIRLYEALGFEIKHHELYFRLSL
jgi:ribosomal protein S18 acetylase RimI-like enzyme